MFEGQIIVKLYFDDILVAYKTPEEYKDHLRKVKTTAREHNLKLNKANLMLGPTAIRYLGLQLLSGGLAPDPAKVKAVKAMSAPTNKAELQRFLGMVTYLTKFIPNFSTTTAPLRELLKTDIAWHWTTQHTETFNLIKTKLETTPVLFYFDQAKPITI